LASPIGRSFPGNIVLRKDIFFQQIVSTYWIRVNLWTEEATMEDFYTDVKIVKNCEREKCANISNTTKFSFRFLCWKSTDGNFQYTDSVFHYTFK
jgi:hypothetical protein